MDKIRVALVAILALITFMMLIEFGQFRDEKNKAAAQERANAQMQQLATVVNRSTTDIGNNQLDDIPTAVTHTEPTITSEEQPVRSNKGLIEVETDNLYVQIDSLGGDIIHLALKEHLAHIDTPNNFFVLLETSPKRTYIAQSGLIGKNATDTADGRPQFTSEYTGYKLEEGKSAINVDLYFQDKGTKITKRFIFHRNDYLIDVDYLIKNESDESWQAAFYAQIKRDGTADPAAENGNMGMTPYLGFATTTNEDRFKKIKFDDINTDKFSATRQGGWIAMIQHYFLSAWIPDKDTENTFSIIQTKSGFNIARVTSPAITIAAGAEGQFHASFYAGPKDQYRLEKISEGLDLSVDYGMLWMLAQPLYALLYFFNEGVFWGSKIFGGFQNWGFSIIALTILVKIAFFSLNHKAYSSMAKMRAIQPKMLEIKDRYADDKQRQSKEMMALYQKEGVNPIGGCLPMLVQMPVFIALYWVLLESVELRHAPFMGYIHDLSAMDPYFIMPLVMGASMYFQQKLNPPPPDPMQAKVMQFLPIIFTFFFLFFPSGLVLYWVVNNLLSIAQQWIITRNIEAKAANNK